MVSRETLLEQFDELGVEPNNDILDKCKKTIFFWGYVKFTTKKKLLLGVEICLNNGVTDPVEFVEQWMAYSLSKLQGAEPTLDFLTEMERKEYTNRKTSVKPKSSFMDVGNDLKIYNYGSKNVIEVADMDIIDSYSGQSPKVGSYFSIFYFFLDLS